MEESIGIIVIIIGVIATIVGAVKKQRQTTVTGADTTVFHPVQSAPAHPQAAPRPAQPAASAHPLVHPHLQPDCETHDAPGSLGVGSMEGKDPCHEQQLTHLRTAPEQTTSHSGLNLEWSGEAMVKAFVMQEVLTRPCQRKAR